MTNYEQSKKARHIADIVYLIFMAFILGGTLLSQNDNGQKYGNDVKDLKTKVTS